MTTRIVLLLGLVASSGCGGAGTDSPPVLSVGGTYQTVVTLLQSDCPGQTVEQHPTAVAHQPGSTALSLTHAGSTYAGTVTATGQFMTPPLSQTIGGIDYVVSITGQFTTTAIDAAVTVAAGRQPPCSFSARWAGPKTGTPNVIP